MSPTRGRLGVSAASQFGHLAVHGSLTPIGLRPGCLAGSMEVLAGPSGAASIPFRWKGASMNRGLSIAARWGLGLLGCVLCGLQAAQQAQLQSGLIYLGLTERGMGHDEAREVAVQVWHLTIVLSLGVPIILGVLLSLWRVKSRLGYAARFSCWPSVYLSGGLGGPIACGVLRVSDPLTAWTWVHGVALLFIGGVVGVIWFGIGYAIWCEPRRQSASPSAGLSTPPAAT